MLDKVNVPVLVLGMPTKGTAKVNNIQVQIRMPKSLRQKADKVAAAESRKFSDWTRLLIEREVKQYEAMMAEYAKSPQVPA